MSRDDRPRRATRSLVLLASLIVLGLDAGALPGTHPKGATMRTGSDAEEYEVKAALMVKITKFVQWPASAFDGPESPFVFAILGADPFGRKIDEMIKGRTIGKHPIRVERYGSVDSVKDCHVLFITRSETGKLSEILRTLGDAPVLLMGEKPRFAHNGGIINFYASRRSRISFELNPKAADQRRLELSPELMKLGREIR